MFWLIFPWNRILDRFWMAPDTDSKVQTPIDLLLLDDEPDDTGPVTFGPEYWRQLGEHTTLEQAEVEHALGEFKKLHTMNLTHLLNQLVLIKANVEKNGTTNKKQMTVLRKTLHHYSNAIRDFQYITGLNTAPRIYRNQKRIALEGSFPGLANPFSGTKNSLAPRTSPITHPIGPSRTAPCKAATASEKSCASSSLTVFPGPTPSDAHAQTFTHPGGGGGRYLFSVCGFDSALNHRDVWRVCACGAVDGDDIPAVADEEPDYGIHGGSVICVSIESSV
ncbi:hypothetical protein, variant [Cladophialophora immunda]|uniref:Uncharacterized protein n=1 Tax=Cladophialophora immunda TaxID=569365 RepID=A0A0D2ASX1_9EURO|nr:uncharacterized protein PV07_07946 [Cladophialophora immunda]XP_016248484.1 hypothetical protein, variant [Cladophialophora immunda]KIW28267.1 hypothetical protein PV07_07946 [Cladophialophora immunda]KIW28268.1 hypothetical protein, variant [Cladophialophora immunda]